MKFKILCLFLCLFCISCVEHVFLFTLDPENYSVSYIAKGDQQDIYDDDFIVPSKFFGWDVIIESQESDNYIYTASKNYSYGDKISDNFVSGNISSDINALVEHPIGIKSRNMFFYKTFEFKGVFKSRGVDKKYPLVNNILINPEDDSVHWISQAIGYNMIESVQRSSIEWNLKGIYVNQINEWLIENLSHKNQSYASDVQIDKADSLYVLSKSFLLSLVPEINHAEVDSIFKFNDDEFKITLDLIDDEFVIKSILPGTISYNNADTISVDTLTWNFDVKDFSNEDYTFMAKSSIYYPKRIIGVFVVAFLLILANSFFGFYRKIRS